MIFKAGKEKWDEWAIRAELKRRGLSFRAMALESGQSASSLRAGLVKPSTNVNHFIAAKLDIPIHELWPSWYFSDGKLIPLEMRKRLKPGTPRESSPETRAA